MATYNKQEILESVSHEKTAQYWMDEHYAFYGLEVDRSVASKLYDVRVVNGTFEHFIEEKFRNTDYGDFLVELFQCLETIEPGWFYHTQADKIEYVVCDKDWKPDKLYKVNWKEFKEWFWNYLKRTNFPKVIISPKGKGISLNISIKWNEIPDDLYKINYYLGGDDVS